MNNIEREFFDAYKKLDKLCREIFDSDYGVSEYIRQMESTPYSEVSGIFIWDRDYKKLKHFRWLRNNIAHSDEESECTYDDIVDILEFRERIFQQQDALSILYIQKKAAQSEMRYSNQTSNQCYDAIFKDDDLNELRKTKNKRPNWSTAKLIIGLISILLFVLIMFQSCVSGFYNTYMDTGEVSGSVGFICAILMLMAAIIMLAARNKVSLGAVIADVIIYFLISVFSYAGASGYPDLVLWGGVAFVFAFFYWGSYLAETEAFKQKYVVIAVVFCGIVGIVCGFLLAAKFSVEFENKQEKMQETLNDIVTQEYDNTLPSYEDYESMLPSYEEYQSILSTYDEITQVSGEIE